jgi:hypothetical protein
MFAREVLPLHTAPISVPKTPASKSCACLTSKLIQTKALQVLHSGHLRKTGGGPPSSLRAKSRRAGISSLFAFNLHCRFSFFSITCARDIRRRMSPLSLSKGSSLSPTLFLPPSGHTNASDGPRLSLRNLFFAFLLSALCVSAVSPSSLHSPPHPSARLRRRPLQKRRRRAKLLYLIYLLYFYFLYFRGHTYVSAAGGRSVLQRCFSLRGAAARMAASNGWAWSKGRERRKRSARRAWAYFS